MSPAAMEAKAAQISSQAGPIRPKWRRGRPAKNDSSLEINGLLAGWGGRDRTSEWRNQNQFDYSTISRGIWKKSGKWASNDINSLGAVSK
ncbi:hypothetical protein ACVI1L_005201 [Bradyrhizobium sp. USDA 4516]